MSDTDDLRTRLKANLALNQAEGFGPGLIHDGIGTLVKKPETVKAKEAQAAEEVDTIDNIDLTRWGSPHTKSDNNVRVRVIISEKHAQIVQAFARRRRMTNRAAYERMIEKFIESGEFARLMDQRD